MTRGRETRNEPNAGTALDWNHDLESDAATPRLPQGGAPCFEERTAVPNIVDPVVDAVMSPGSPVAEEFRVLRERIRTIGDEKAFRSVGVVSAASGEGKTVISLGLAAAIAQEPGRRVLLVETDTRRPMIESYLGLANDDGLVDWLERGCGAVSVRRIMPYAFWLLSAGSASLDRPERLGSERMVTLVETARQCFDFVLLDCPPLAAAADSVILQDLLDGFVLVVRARHSAAETIARALSRLKAGRIQGVVFNDDREILSHYYKDAYRRYPTKR